MGFEVLEEAGRATLGRADDHEGRAAWCAFGPPVASDRRERLQPVYRVGEGASTAVMAAHMRECARLRRPSLVHDGMWHNVSVSTCCIPRRGTEVSKSETNFPKKEIHSKSLLSDSEVSRLSAGLDRVLCTFTPTPNIMNAASARMLRVSYGVM